MFEAKGFMEARITDITSSAQMSAGSFYSYFNSKEELFAEVIREFAWEIYQLSSGADDDEFEDLRVRIHVNNRRYLEAYRQNARMMQVMEQMASMDPKSAQIRREIRFRFVRRNERGIRRLQELGLADPDLDAWYAASALASMMDNFAYVWFVLGEPFEERGAVMTLTRLWLKAIGAQVPEELDMPSEIT